jgi:hypothetical protein
MTLKKVKSSAVSKIKARSDLITITSTIADDTAAPNY